MNILILLLFIQNSFSRITDGDFPQRCNRESLNNCMRQNQEGERLSSDQIASISIQVTHANAEKNGGQKSLHEVEERISVLEKNIELAEKELNFLPKKSKGKSDLVVEEALIHHFALDRFSLDWLEPYPLEREKLITTFLAERKMEKNLWDNEKSKLKQQLDSYESSCAWLNQEKDRLENNKKIHAKMISSGCSDAFCPQ